MSTFTWLPDWSARANVSVNLRRTKFGEGYELRQAIGMNSIIEEWDLTFSLRDFTEADAILDFVETAGGVDSFDWENPDGVTAKYICTSWPHSIENYNRKTINLKFERVYEP